jgi:dienelactone hydrolase
VLAGTLTTPQPKGRVPAAILITGLSKHERNNGDPPWMPFRDIADALTRAGIAVLRVDDRGVGKSTGDQSKWTSFDKANDVTDTTIPPRSAERIATAMRAGMRHFLLAVAGSWPKTGFPTWC